MDERLKKLRKINEILRNKAIISEEKPREILRADIGYALPEEFPAPSLMRKTSPDEKWGGEKDFHALFYLEVDCGARIPGKRKDLAFFTDKDRFNPQATVYEDGKALWA